MGVGRHVFVAVNTDKLALTLDLQTPRGRDLCADLIRWADVVVENFSPRVAESWGFDREGVLAINPKVVYCRMPAFGLTGPWRDRVGFAQTMEQLSMAWITGYVDDQPMIPRGPCDPLAGLHADVAILTALAERDTTGTGQFVESIMLEAALNTCAEPIVEHSAYGRLMERMGNRSPHMAPQGVYACQGIDTWIAISVGSDAQWEGLRLGLDDPDWAKDQRFASPAGRSRHHDLLDEHLCQWAATGHDVDAAVGSLLERGVPAARGWDPRSLDEHPQYRAAGSSRTWSTPPSATIPFRGCPTALRRSTAGPTGPRRPWAWTTSTFSPASSG